MINFNITDGIAVAEFDQPNSKANILNMDFFIRLNEILEEVEGNKDIKNVYLRKDLVNHNSFETYGYSHNKN